MPFGSEAQRFIARLSGPLFSGALERQLSAVGGRTPANEQLQQLAVSLQAAFDRTPSPGTQLLVRAAGLYGTPSVKNLIDAFAEARVDRVVAVSLYPQRCNVFIRPLQRALDVACGQHQLPFSIVDRYGTAAWYVAALREALNAALFRFSGATVVLAALPISSAQAKEGDPYLEQLRATAASLFDGLQVPWHLTWLAAGAPGLRTDVVLAQLLRKHVEAVVVVPIGTALDELEVLYPLSVELLPVAKQFRHFERAAVAVTERGFVEGLATEVREHLARVVRL